MSDFTSNFSKFSLLVGSVSLLSLNAGQAYAQCMPAETAGDDVFTCVTVATPVRQVFKDGGNDEFNVAAGEILDLPAAVNVTAFLIRDTGNVTLNNDGIIQVASGSIGAGDVIRIDPDNLAADLIIDNTGSILNNTTSNAGVSAAIQVGEDFRTLNFTNTGTISSTRQAIYFGNGVGNFNPASYISSNFTNSGLIRATGGRRDALFLGSGDDTVINEAGATIDGNINFSEGNDNFTNRGALVNVDTLDLGVGDDTLLSSFDTGSLSADTVDGGDGRDILTLESAADQSFSIGSGFLYENFEVLNLQGGGDYIISGNDPNLESINLLETTIGGVPQSDNLTIDGSAAVAVSSMINGNDNDNNFFFNGDVDGDLNAGLGDDYLLIDLDTGSYTGTADGEGHAVADTVELNTDGNVSNNLSSFTNWEELVVSGDGTLTVTGDDADFTNTTLDDNAGITIANSIIWDTNITGGIGNNTVTVLDTLNGNVALGDGNDSFINSGDVTGNISTTLGTNAFTFQNGSTVTGNVNVSTGTDIITLNGGNITGDINDANVGAASSSLIVNNTSVVGGDITLNNTRLNSGAQLDTNSLTTDSITFEVDSTTNRGFLNVTGGAINLTGVSIVSLIDNSVPDNPILIGEGTGAVIGLADPNFNNIIETSVLYDFGVADGLSTNVGGGGTSNELYLLTEKVADVSDIVLNENTKNVGETLEAIEAIASINDPQIDQIILNMNLSGSADELEDVLNAAIPAVDDGSFSAAQNVTGNTLRLVSDRLTVIRDHGGSGSGISSGDLTENIQMWGQVFGQKLQQGERDSIKGFDAHTRGGTIGFDTEAFHEEATVGVAFSYADTNVASASNNRTRTEINSYNLSLYGDYDITEDTYLVGDIGYTYGDTESERFDIGGVAGLDAQSDYGSHQFETRIIAAQDHELEGFDGVRLTPKAQAHYIHFENEDIRETGAGGAGLNIESEGLDILEFGIGLDARKDYKTHNGGVLSPEISVGYRYDVIGDPIQTTATFQAGGPSFRSEGADPDQDTLNLGIGIGYTGPNDTELTISYDYEKKDEFNSHSGFIRLAAPF